MSKNQLYTFDLLEKEDYYRGFLELLEQLTVVDAKNISYEDFCKTFDEMNAQTYVVRNISTNKIVGTGSLLVEKKFIHKLSSVGHIEDIVIDSSVRGFGLGKQLIDHLVNLAKEKGCYKVILNCSDKNIKFYEKCGFVIKEFGMAKYF